MEDVRATIQQITPEVAAQMLEKNDINRPLSKQRVEYYARQMREGKWQLNGESISVAADGTLLNGQTRLNAVIAAGVTVPMLIVTGIRKETFASFDQGRNRSNSDIFSIAGVPNARKVSTIVTRYIALKSNNSFMNDDASIGCSYTKDSLKRFSKGDLLKIYEQHADAFRSALLFCDGLIRREIRLLMLSEIGAFYVYETVDMGHNNETVENFLTGLFSKRTTHLASLQLYKKLLDSKQSSTKLSSVMKTNLFIKTWNAYIEGRDYKTLRWSTIEGKLKLK